MVKIQKNKSLKPLTTFKIGGPAKNFAAIRGTADLHNAVEFAKKHRLQILMIGGGSNMLVSDKGHKGLVLNMKTKGIELVAQPDGKYHLRAAAGEIWDDVVAFAVREGLWGVENLSHIPGQAGAAVIQNIGAYGQEIADTLEQVEVYDLTAGKIRLIKKAQCQFSYRKSIFNSSQKGKYVVLAITLRLNKNGAPKLEYKDLQKYFSEKAKPSLAEIRQAVTAIRDNKYPFPKTAKDGSAGSFFKNVYLRGKEYRNFEAKFAKSFGQESLPELRAKAREAAGNGIKIPTAFLIEKCGFKGYANAGAVVNQKQPLILMNKGNARAKDVIALANKIIQTVQKKTGVKLEIEPELIGF